VLQMCFTHDLLAAPMVHVQLFWHLSGRHISEPQMVTNYCFHRSIRRSSVSNYICSHTPVNHGTGLTQFIHHSHIIHKNIKIKNRDNLHLCVRTAVTNCMMKSCRQLSGLPSSSHLLWNLKVNYCVHKSLPLGPIQRIYLTSLRYFLTFCNMLIFTGKDC